MPPSVLAAALFASHLQPSDRPSAARIRDAVRRSHTVHGGQSGCAAVVAAEYGEHPDTAVARMRWALTLATTAAVAVGAGR